MPEVFFILLLEGISKGLLLGRRLLYVVLVRERVDRRSLIARPLRQLHSADKA